jgi:hypothetical protein
MQRGEAANRGCTGSKGIFPGMRFGLQSSKILSAKVSPLGRLSYSLTGTSGSATGKYSRQTISSSGAPGGRLRNCWDGGCAGLGGWGLALPSYGFGEVTRGRNLCSWPITAPQRLEPDSFAALTARRKAVPSLAIRRKFSFPTSSCAVLAFESRGHSSALLSRTFQSRI